jgi:hypothetical protein
MPTVTLTLGCFSLNFFAAASVIGKTVLEPSAVTCPLRPLLLSSVSVPLEPSPVDEEGDFSHPAISNMSPMQHAASQGRFALIEILLLCVIRPFRKLRETYLPKIKDQLRKG